MKGPTDRRSVLIAAVLAATGGAVAAQTPAIQGHVDFRGGTAVPEGTVEIYLEDPSVKDRALRRLSQARVPSDGTSRTVGFSLPPPAGAREGTRLQVIARLERGDGWLIARGSAAFDLSAPVVVTLREVTY